jgi:hypothetical protein
MATTMKAAVVTNVGTVAAAGCAVGGRSTDVSS